MLSAKIDLETGARPSPPTSAGIRMQPAIPIVRIFSVEEAKEFYVDFLGFAFDWGYDGDDQDMPLYAQISRSGTMLHLSEHHGDASPGTGLLIRMTGLDVFHQELSNKMDRFARPGISHTPWDTREVVVTDPFGNRLRFSENNAPGVFSPE
jgi:catechol 2,3-dioxygenase-like lactoylglutathione lyase family enzyme